MTMTRMQQKWQVIKDITGSANVEVVAHSNYPLSSLSRFSVVRSNNLAVSTGLVHSELTVKLVGFAGHENKCCVVWGEPPQSGHLSSIFGSILER